MVSFLPFFVVFLSVCFPASLSCSFWDYLGVKISPQAAEQLVHLRHRPSNEWGIPVVPIRLEQILYKTKATRLIAFTQLNGLLGMEWRNTGGNAKPEWKSDIREPWIEGSVGVDCVHELNKRFLGMLVGLYASYRLGLHGAGLDAASHTCVHSVVGKVVLSYPTDQRNKIIVGIAQHLNYARGERPTYVYMEIKSKHMPHDISIGIGGGELPGDHVSAAELFVKLPLPKQWEFICLPVIKMGWSTQGPFVRLGSE